MRTGLGLVLIVALVGAACSANPSTARGTSDGQISVVVAESSWASIASQLGGDRVHVTTIVSSPDVDPHDFEPTPADARAIASAQYVIFNGVGYDPWMRDMLDANDATGRRVLEVGSLLGLSDDANPHRWYFPDDVASVIDRITADLEAMSPVDTPYFAQQRGAFTSSGLSRYHALLAEITVRYHGTPIAASESIVEGIATATQLELTTPRSFMTAISEGTDPPTQDKKTVEDQLTTRRVRVFVYNRQNATPDVTALLRDAERAGIPTVTITETPPAGVTFQEWQGAQLQALLTALSQEGS